MNPNDCVGTGPRKPPEGGDTGMRVLGPPDSSGSEVQKEL